MDTQSLRPPSILQDKLQQVQGVNNDRQNDLKMLIFLQRQYNPKMSMDDAIRGATQYLHQRDMKQTLMNMHFNMNNYNLQQRRQLGIERQPGEYVPKYNGLHDLWTPRKEQWM